ncbi:MAG: HAMP domain-containing sensor histidine kinase [Campylobacterota bacterium]|nr:HAMP domain-containing sensor histidine kinase [Campylobacterota bacterium]
MGTNTSTKLHFLIAIFLIGFISLFGLNQFFIKLVNDVDKESKTHKSKIVLGEFIAEDIQTLKAYFFELATTTTSKRGRKIVINKIDETMDTINNSLDVLEHGGTLKRVIKLNIEGHSSTVKEVSYNPIGKQLALEVIDLRPKLIELKDMINEVERLLSLRNKYKRAKDNDNFANISKEIRRFYKSTPAFFTRMSENIRRLLYEGDLELNEIKKTIEDKKSLYLNIKMSLIFVVILIVLLLGWWISKIIQKDNESLIKLNSDLKKTEASIRGLLDAQPNIIVVTDGIHMIDANKRVLEFFDNYSTFESFADNVECICSFFEKNVPDDSYITEERYGEDTWTDYILKNPDIPFKVIMKKNGQKRHFAISVNKTIIHEETQESVVIVTLNDITSEISSQIKLKSLNDNLELIVANKTKELQELNENLEQKVLIEALKVREKDKQMIQQARFAALGEMIANIAHQWRQPLSAINTTASGMQLQMQLGISNDKDISDSFTNIMGYVEFLTQTIEDFRGFFKEDKETSDFNIINSLDKTITIISSAYKDNDITIINKCEGKVLLTHGMHSELSQVFLNILNNAKDATISNNIEEKFVYINCKELDKMYEISIQDNAGGIPEDIIEKVFDPYFTTKHQSQGTGIGLYMSKDIIEKNMNGFISVKNMKTTLDDRAYNGACFKIMLPKAV